MLSKLIAALQIFLKYGDDQRPTHCDHDILRVSVDPAVVSAEDKRALKTLHFEADEDLECFYSFHYGSN